MIANNGVSQFGIRVNNGVTVLGVTADGVLEQGIDFDCQNACWGKVGNHELFKKLQRQLNRFAANVGFTPLVVDGFIGETTVAAMIAVNGGPSTKEAVAAQAAKLVPALNDLANMGNLTMISDPSPRVYSSTDRAIAQQTARAATAAGDTNAAKGAGGSNLWWWILGGIAAAGIGTVGYMTWQRRQQGGKKGKSKSRTARVRTPRFAHM